MFYLLFYIIVQIIQRAGLDSFVGSIRPVWHMFDTPGVGQKHKRRSLHIKLVKCTLINFCPKFIKNVWGQCFHTEQLLL